MNATQRTVDFNNAILAELERDGRDLIVRLRGVIVRAAAVVEAPSPPIRQDAEIRVSNATVVGRLPSLAQTITGSVWLVGAERHRDAVPLPQIHRGAVRIHFDCANADRLALRGAGVTVLLRGTQVVLTQPGELRTH